MAKQATRAELQAEIDRLNKQLQNQSTLEREGRKYAEIEQENNIAIWRADGESERPGCICVSLGNGLSINIYPVDGPAQGMVVFDESEFVGAFGLVPAEFLVQEVEYARQHG